MGRHQVQIIIQCALSSPCVGRDRLTKITNAVLIDNGLKKVAESTIRNVLDEWELGNAEKRFLAIRSLVKQGNPNFQVVEDSIPRSKLMKNAPFKILPDYPGQIGFYGLIKVCRFPKNLYQQTFIDGYSSFAVVELLEETNDEISSSFLKKCANTLSKMNGREISKIYCGKYYKNQGEFIEIVERGNLEVNICWHDKKENLFSLFSDKIKSDFYSELTAAPLPMLQARLNKWIGEYNRTSNSRRYCYGKSPLQTFNDFIG